MNGTKKKTSSPRTTTATAEKRIAALEKALAAETKANTGRTKTIITRMNQAVGAFRPNDLGGFVNQLRDLASDLEHTV